MTHKPNFLEHMTQSTGFSEIKIDMIQNPEKLVSHFLDKISLSLTQELYNNLNLSSIWFSLLIFSCVKTVECNFFSISFQPFLDIIWLIGRKSDLKCPTNLIFLNMYSNDNLVTKINKMQNLVKIARPVF